MNHKILPAFMGYHIALYCRKVTGADDQYLGHYKVFPQRPSDYWTPGHIAQKCLGGVANSSQSAMAHAEELGKLCVLNLPASGTWQDRTPNGPALSKPGALCATCEFGERPLDGRTCAGGPRCESSIGLLSRRI